MTRWRKLAHIGWWLRHERLACRLRPVAEVATTQADPTSAVRWLGDMAIGGETHHALMAHPDTSIVYRLHACPGDEFVASCAIVPEVWDQNTGGVEFSIAIAGTTESARASARLAVPAGRASGERKWKRLRVPVPLRREGEVAVTLTTRVPPGASGAYAWAIWGEPALVRRRTLPETGALLRGAAAGAFAQGPVAAARALHARSLAGERETMYRRWFAMHAPGPAELARMRERSKTFPYRPLISIITPVYNTDPTFLRACIESVRRQAYDTWELCLRDDGSTSEATVRVLRAQKDPRVRVSRAERNAGISEASNAALAMARGEFVALLDHDDELTPDALYEMVAYLNEHRDADVIYSDEDKRDADGGLSEPFFKPDWSPEHLLSAAYMCHLTVARKTLVDRVGGFRRGYEGAQDHDLTLRLSERTSRIHHLPKVLYHWRRAPQSTATAGSAKPWADDAGRLALVDHAARNQWGAEVLSGGVPGLYRVKFPIAGQPRILIVVVAADATRADANACVSRIRATSGYGRYDVTIAEAAGAALTAEVNKVIRRRPGAHVVLHDALVDPLDGEWLTALLEYSHQEAIGAAGGRIEYSDGTLRHIGVITATDPGPLRPFDRQPGNIYGYFSSAIGVRNYSAVSGEAMMTRRDVFERLDGFDERLPWRVADVDYCVRARTAGFRVVFTPYARFRVRSSPPPAPEASAIRALRDIHGAALSVDPYYNPNLSRRSADYLLDDIR